MPLPREYTVKGETCDGITNNSKDDHTGRPRNFYGNPKTGKMTCSLEKITEILGGKNCTPAAL